MRRLCGVVGVAAVLCWASGCAAILGIEAPRDGEGDGGGAIPSASDAALANGFAGSGSANGSLAPESGSGSSMSAAGSSGLSDGGDLQSTNDAESIDGAGAAMHDSGAGSNTPVVVQTNATFSGGSMSSTIEFAPTQAGDTLIVGTGADCTTPIPAVVSITDNKGNAYYSSGYRATDPTAGCDDATELWYAKNVAAGTTSVTIVYTAMTVNEAWFMEVAGLSATAPFVTGAATGSPPRSGDIATAPQVPAAADSLVVCVYTCCNSSSGLHSGTPFIDLAVEDTEYTAYYIPSDAGTFGAVWDQSGGTYNIVTGVFH